MNQRAAAMAVGEALGEAYAESRRPSVSLEPEVTQPRRRSTAASDKTDASRPSEDVSAQALEASLRFSSILLEGSGSPTKKQQRLDPATVDTLRASADGMPLGALSKSEAEYDFAIVLKPTRPDDNAVARHVAPATNLRAFYRKHPQQAKVELLRRLHAAGLQTKKLRALDGKQTLIKVKAPGHVLELGAEKMRLKKRRQVDLMWVEFAADVRETFQDFRNGDMHFLDSEKQSIVHNLLTTDDGAGLNEHSDLLPIIEQMLPLHKANLDLLRTHWVCYWRPSSPSSVPVAARTLYRILRYALDQPLDLVAEYFGEHVAFYFAWVQLYTRWLVLPTVVGIYLFYCQVATKSLDQPFAPYYALFMALWASGFLLAWKRQANSLAYRWGVLGYEDEEVLRPAYHKGGLHRWLKYAVTYTVVLAAIALVLALMYYAFTTRDALAEESLALQANLTHIALNWSNLSELHALANAKFWVFVLLTPMLYGLCIPMLDLLFTLLATRMTEWENHKTASAFQSALILKVFPFRFVHVFATLYYYAFAAGNDLLRVAIQLATFMLSGQMWHNVVKTGVPLLRRVIRHRRKSQATAKLLRASPFFRTTAPTAVHRQCIRLEQASSLVWDESQLDKYDPFDDYTEMLIQFGYVSFFSIAFPLAPLLALVNNLIALRADAFKLCHTKQRPIARKASGIGIWLPVLQAMSILAVLTNCLHVAFTTTQMERMAPTISPAQKVWVVFAAEHSVLLLQVAIACAVPSMTKDVKASVRAEKAMLKNASAKAVAARLACATIEDDDDGNDSDTPEKSAL
ncbi:hypothetical protein SPRG_05094 [Saprolegnia parasitica CBS 223.65]|uniref:Anoctamin transmembrane domain-containing protein n=1 Tax=Saprolegnia parasitica (strain CBS 223.65) TaxID=695850 RepID=A0A067CIP0_SAPPC|nr:hypothetical protein SPRG_05094 [Saprolegnia parasitica CBS 223.65]KDO30383.1 hypothetical protein SPRG_05094 [Saprolegnia parasitica CBS 223.65]|eukprot:XP_012198993.1 hypothetical protein SPRG_05094 [Saprolegnia parasitica CBS 223.65]